MNVLLSKAVIITVLLLILCSLGSALALLLKGPQAGGSLARALTWRVVLSLLLFGALFLFFFLGWLRPHAILQL